MYFYKLNNYKFILKNDKMPRNKAKNNYKSYYLSGLERVPNLKVLNSNLRN